MDAPNPSDPRALLATLEQRARKRFGQHFLVRTDLVEAMVRGAHVAAGDRVVEIGPGLGILTQELRRVRADLTAVELDRDLAAYLRERWPDLNLVEGDAAKVDWDVVCPGGGWKVVANLPYNVGTTILMQLADHPVRFRSITVMLQLEVIQRVLATPGTKSYGALTVQIQARGTPRFLLSVPPSSFHPPPKVQSAVVRLDLHPEPQAGPAGLAALDRTVRAAFSQRRKMLHNSLMAGFTRDRVDAALALTGIDGARRAETLTLTEYQGLAAALHAG